MRRGIFAFIFTAILIISLPILASGFPNPQYDEVTSGISGDSAIGFNGKLTEWVRVAGSEQENNAAAYIKDTLEGYGYNAFLQEFPILYFEEKSWDLDINSPEGTDVELHPNIMTYSPSGDVTADLVFAGLGKQEDYQALEAEGKSVSGKIALIKRGELYFSEKVANAYAAGAIGAVIFNNVPDNFFGTLGSPGAIPAVSLSLEEGETLLALMSSGPVTVRLYTDVIMEYRTSRNVVATKPAPREVGTGHTIIIGGHYDNVSVNQGANDNASGTAVMLEVARVLQDYDLNADVKFIAFGAEELGLYGSEYYVNNMSKDEIMKTRAMINLDMVGVGETLTAGDMRKNDGWLVKYIKRYGSAFNQEVLSFEAEDNSDHAFFEEKGIPVCFMTWETDPYYHTVNDTLDKINTYNLEMTGKISAAAIYDLANTPPPRSDETEPAKVNKNKVFFKGKFIDKL